MNKPYTQYKQQIAIIDGVLSKIHLHRLSSGILCDTRFLEKILIKFFSKGSPSSFIKCVLNDNFCEFSENLYDNVILNVKVYLDNDRVFIKVTNDYQQELGFLDMGLCNITRNTLEGSVND